jgi:hypothetical protein
MVYVPHSVGKQMGMVSKRGETENRVMNEKRFNIDHQKVDTVTDNFLSVCHSNTMCIHD